MGRVGLVNAMRKIFVPLTIVTAAMFAYAPIAIANAPFVADLCHRFYNLPRSRVFLVPYWMDRPPFTPALAEVSGDLGGLFERAFLPGSESANARPSATDWATPARTGPMGRTT